MLTMCLMKNLQTLKHLQNPTVKGTARNILPDKLVGKTLLCLIEKSSYTLSDHKSQTYRSILQMCHTESHSSHVVVKPTFNRKLKVSVRKITAGFALASGLIREIAQYVNCMK